MNRQISILSLTETAVTRQKAIATKIMDKKDYVQIKTII